MRRPEAAKLALQVQTHLHRSLCLESKFFVGVISLSLLTVERNIGRIDEMVGICLCMRWFTGYFCGW